MAIYVWGTAHASGNVASIYCAHLATEARFIGGVTGTGMQVCATEHQHISRIYEHWFRGCFQLLLWQLARCQRGQLRVALSSASSCLELLKVPLS